MGRQVTVNALPEKRTDPDNKNIGYVQRSASEPLGMLDFLQVNNTIPQVIPELFFSFCDVSVSIGFSHEGEEQQKNHGNQQESNADHPDTLEKDERQADDRWQISCGIECVHPVSE